MSKNAAATREPIAIVGMSCLFPDAPGLKDYWRLIRRREDAIRDVPDSHWRRNDYFNENPKTPDHVYCTRGGFLSETDFDPLAYGIPPATLEAVDTAQLLGLVVAEQALNDAGIATRDATTGKQQIRENGECGHPARANFDRTRIGVTLGVTSALEMIIPLGARLGHPRWRRGMIEAGIDPQIADDVVNNISESYVGWQENSFPGLLGNVVAGRIANRLNLHGTNCVVDAACASSLSALHLAMMELQTGRADTMVTGGVDTFNDIFMFMCFAKTQALSKSGDARPFDAGADGTVLGEGIGMLVLKRLSDAERDNDKIYAVIRGLGTSSDGRSQSIYAPRAEGQARCLRNAYEDAGVSPASVDMVEAHGTGTSVGDAVEFDALQTVFREVREEGQWAAIGSVKSQIGHAKAAAGVASLVKAVLALQNRTIPPTIKVDQPNEKLEIENSPFYIATEPRPWFTNDDEPRRAGVSSFGFGGSNFHTVLEEYPVADRTPVWDGSVEIIALSADSRDELFDKLRVWQTSTKCDESSASNANACPTLSGWGTELPAEQIAWRAAQSRESFDASHSQRLIIVLERGKSLPTLLDQAANALQNKKNEETWQLPNIFFGSAATAGKLAFLFPGQGAQYLNMGRDLACTFPQAHDAIAESNAVFGGESLLSDHVYPQPTFDAARKEKQNEALRDTAVAQPALGAVSLAMLRVLDYFKIKPDATAGHSFGELPALRAAGRIGDEALRLLSKMRGALMGEDKSDRGTMLAVQAPAAEIDALLEQADNDVVLASRNGPQQSTLSGGRDAIQKFMQLCDARGWPSKALNVAAAFHSKFMNTAQEKFAAFLKEIDIHPGKIPVYANLTGLEYPEDADEARALLAQQITNPVRFMEEIKHLYENGVRTFVEVGPKTTLTNFAKAILNGQPFHAIALDASAGRGCGVADLARVVALVAVLGHAVDLNAWEATEEPADAPAMAVKLVGANYRATKPTQSSATDMNKAGRTAAATTSHQARGAPPPETVSETTMVNAQTDTHGSSPHANGAGPAHANGNGVAVPPPDARDSRLQDIPATPFAAQANVAVPAPPPRADGAQLSHAFQLAQEGLRAMQTLQQQTAYAHQKFLESQEAAHRSFQMVMQQQQNLLNQSAGMPIAPLPPQPIAPQQPASTMPPATPIAPPQPTSFIPQQQNFAPQPAAPQQFAQPVPQAAPAPATPQHAPVSIQPIPLEQHTNGHATNGHANGAAAHTNGDTIHYQDAPANDRFAPATAPQAAASKQPAPTTTPAPAQTESTTDFSSVLLEVVAELTGYPQEMIDLDMDMEADLGIDSIKRLEILAATQERAPDMREVDSQYMGSLRTLQDIISYVSEDEALAETPPGKAHSGSASPDAEPHNSDTSAATPRLTADGYAIDTTRRVLTAVAQPASEARVPLTLPRDGTVFVTRDDAGLAEAIVETLTANDLSAKIVDLENAASEIDGGRERIAGLIVVADAADDPSSSTSTAFLRSAFQSARAFATAASQHESNTTQLFATVSRVDGAFGLHEGIGNISSGGLAGLTKTASHEGPQTTCRAIDVAASWSDKKAIAECLVEELLHTGPIEVGFTADNRFVLESREIDSEAGQVPLEPGDVVVVSGGARGVTAACLLELAKTARPTLILLGRSPAPIAEPDWLTVCVDDAAIKRGLLQNEFADQKPRPAEVEKRFKFWTANREVSQNLAALREHAAAVEYHSVDIRDKDAVADCLTGIRESHRPIRGIVHAAGVLADAFIAQKTDEQFDRVIGTKLDGMHALLNATRGDDLKLIAIYSSVTARFGREGQVDYAIANEVLNKTAHQLRTTRPSCRVVSIGWGPWDGGMVTSAHKREFAKLGVGLIPLAEGARCFVREIAQPPTAPVEVLIGGTFPKSENETDSRAVHNNSHVAASEPNRTPSAKQGAETPAVWKATISPDNPACLRDHQIGGRPIVPIALMIEWFAQATRANDGSSSNIGLRDLRVLRACPVKDQLIANIRQKRNGKAATYEFRSTDPATGQTTLHANATIETAAALAMPTPQQRGAISAADQSQKTCSADEVYNSILFHGPLFHTFTGELKFNDFGAIAALRQSPPNKNFASEDSASAPATAPFYVDALLQLGIVWCDKMRGAPSLPAFIKSAAWQTDFATSKPTRAELVVKKCTKHKLTADAFLLSDGDNCVASLIGVEWTIDPSLHAAFFAEAGSAGVGA